MEKKQPISIRLKAWWSTLPLSVQNSAAYIASLFITFLIAVLQGMEVWQAFVVFAVGSLLSIRALMAVSKTADGHIESISAENN